MSITFEVSPVGHVRSHRKTPTDDEWDGVRTSIELDTKQFGKDAFFGLEEFSHVEVIFLFDQVQVAKIERGARHPRGRSDWPLVGIFSQRGKNRPNRIGATFCKVISIKGTALEVQGLDAIDGTPVLDIKPIMSGFERRGALKEPDWAKEIMASYW